MKLVSYLQHTKKVSRRDFADMVRAQVIFVNDVLVTQFDQTIEVGNTLKILLPNGDTRTESIKKFPVIHPKLVLFHKPKGLVVSKQDPHNRTIYDILPDHRRQEYRYIGRLDKESTGLLLLTNAPHLVDRYESPVNNIHKVYQVYIDKPLRSKDKVKCKKGVMVTPEGTTQKEEKQPAELLSCVTVSYQKTSKGKHLVIFTLNEGKNRHIRRLCKALGYKVLELHRLKIGKRHIDTLKPGKWRIEKAQKRIKTSKSSKKKREKQKR